MPTGRSEGNREKIYFFSLFWLYSVVWFAGFKTGHCRVIDFGVCVWEVPRDHARWAGIVLKPFGASCVRVCAQKCVSVCVCADSILALWKWCGIRSEEICFETIVWTIFFRPNHYVSFRTNCPNKKSALYSNRSRRFQVWKLSARNIHSMCR